MFLRSREQSPVSWTQVALPQGDLDEWEILLTLLTKLLNLVHKQCKIYKCKWWKPCLLFIKKKGKPCLFSDFHLWLLFWWRQRWRRWPYNWIPCQVNGNTHHLGHSFSLRRKSRQKSTSHLPKVCWFGGVSRVLFIFIKHANLISREEENSN